MKQTAAALTQAKNVTITAFDGPNPAGNVLEVCIDGKWMVFKRRYVDESQVYFAGRWWDKSGLSEDTLRWLAWYNGLTGEEQASISSVPADLLDESGISRTEETDAQAN